MVYLTGDLHGDIRPIQRFSHQYETTKDDILIILGDAGFNYFVKWSRELNKYKADGSERYYKKLKKIPLTILVVQGNHEAPAWCCSQMKQIDYKGGKAWQSELAPNVIFLSNGEIYNIADQKILVMGGGYSIDRIFASRTRPEENVDNGNRNYFPEELMTEDEFNKAKENLKRNNNKVDLVLTHTCPVSKRPEEMLLPDVKFANNSMEEEFENIMDTFEFHRWYFGHFHTDRKIDRRFRCVFFEFVKIAE